MSLSRLMLAGTSRRNSPSTLLLLLDNVAGRLALEVSVRSLTRVSGKSWSPPDLLGGGFTDPARYRSGQSRCASAGRVTPAMRAHTITIGPFSQLNK